MKKQKSWADYYKNHDSVRFSNIILHWPYLFSIWKNHKKNILEIGCGPGDHSVFLSKYMPDTHISLLDNDTGIIKWLKNKYKNKFKLLLCDITNKKEVEKLKMKKNSFDVIYSQGLMEHFDEKKFIDIIVNFLPYSKKTIFSIPSDEYPNRDFGNELLRSKKELRQILKKIPGITYTVKSYFPDISIRTKFIKIQKRKMGLIQSLRYLLFGSNHHLVEVTKIKE